MRHLGRSLVLSIRILTPIVFRAMGAGLRLVIMVVAVWYRGMTEAISNLAHDQLRRASVQPIPLDSEHENLLYQLSVVFTIVELTIGWVIAAYLTVWAVNALIARLF